MLPNGAFESGDTARLLVTNTCRGKLYNYGVVIRQVGDRVDLRCPICNTVFPEHSDNLVLGPPVPPVMMRFGNLNAVRQEVIAVPAIGELYDQLQNPTRRYNHLAAANLLGIATEHLEGYRFIFRYEDDLTAEEQRDARLRRREEAARTYRAQVARAFQPTPPRPAPPPPPRINAVAKKEPEPPKDDKFTLAAIKDAADTFFDSFENSDEVREEFEKVFYETLKGG